MIELTSGQSYRLHGRLAAVEPSRSKPIFITRTRPEAVWAIPVAILCGVLTWAMLTAFLPAAGIQMCRQAIQAARGVGQ